MNISICPENWSIEGTLSFFSRRHFVNVSVTFVLCKQGLKYFVI